MSTWKYIDWLRLLVNGELDPRETYVIHAYKVNDDGSISLYSDASYPLAHLDEVTSERLSVSTLSDYYNVFIFDVNNRSHLRNTRYYEGHGQTTMFHEVMVNYVYYRVYWDYNVRNEYLNLTVYEFIVRGATTRRYHLPARNLRSILEQVGSLSFGSPLNSDVVEVIPHSPYSHSRIGNALPLDIIHVLGLQPYIIRLFVVNGYHDRSMRTNVGRVRNDHFKRTSDDVVNSPSFTHVGLELEFMSRDRLSQSSNLYHHRVFERLFVDPNNEAIYNHFDVSTDSSLDDRGYEMVSLPMSLSYIKANKSMFDKIYRHMGQNLMFFGGSTHAHFDRSFILGENDRYMDAVSYFMDAVWWSNDLLRSDEMFNIKTTDGLTITTAHMIDAIAGRRATRYCQRNNTIRLSPESDHSNWVTVKPNTVEIRRFSTSFSSDDLINKIEFVINTVDAIKKLVEGKNEEVTIRKALRIIINNHYLRKLEALKSYATNNGFGYIGSAMLDQPMYRSMDEIDYLITKQREKLATLTDDILGNRKEE